jgi:serine protease Do
MIYRTTLLAKVGGRGRGGLKGSLLSLLFAVTLAASVVAGQAAVAFADTPGAPAAAQAPAQNSYAGVVSRAAPAVVTIRSERMVRGSQRLPFMDDPMFREFFRRRNPSPGTPRQEDEPRERQRGVGSGVVVSADGYILTNHHVVDGAEQITVEFNDNRTFKAKLVGSDEPSDLAVLKIESKDLPVLRLADSDRVQVGDIVLAIGNPLGIGQTVTSGIISAKGRQTGLGDGSFEDFLQTDAPINRGNSGGALVSTDGELVGINSQILSPSGGSIGIGFAIPANMARDVMTQLIANGKVRRGMIGVNIQAVTPDLAESLSLPQARGALVSNVQAGGPAERAGVRRGDVITSFNGAPVTDSNSFRNMVARTRPGTEVSFTVLRDNREQQLRATLAELPVEQSANAGAEGEKGADNTNEGGKLGVRVEQLTPELAARMELPRESRGLVVTSVDSAGPGADAGLQRGDLIQEVNRQPVNTLAELRDALGRSATRPVLLLVARDGRTLYLTARPRP